MAHRISVRHVALLSILMGLLTLVGIAFTKEILDYSIAKTKVRARMPPLFLQPSCALLLRFEKSDRWERNDDATTA